MYSTHNRKLIIRRLVETKDTQLITPGFEVGDYIEVALSGSKLPSYQGEVVEINRYTGGDFVGIVSTVVVRNNAGNLETIDYNRLLGEFVFKKVQS